MEKRVEKLLMIKIIEEKKAIFFINTFKLKEHNPGLNPGHNPGYNPQWI